MIDNETDKISVEKAIQVLHEDGISVTVEQAKIILDFLYLMSEIVVNQYLNTDEIL